MTDLYDIRLYHVDPKTGERKTEGHNHGAAMNATPMTLDEAYTMRSKLTHGRSWVYAVEPTKGGHNGDIKRNSSGLA